MRLVGYLRVSSRAQAQAHAERGAGLDTQKAGIGAWCEAEGHEIVGWYVDKVPSGAQYLAQRVGLADALDAVESGAAEGIVVYKLDRWARDVVLQEQLLAELYRSDGSLFSSWEGGRENEYLGADVGPSRKMVRQILGAVADYERAMIRLRMVAGAKRKTAAGGYAWGRPGYGWRAEDKELVPVAEEQAIIARIRELRSGPEPMSFARVAATLNGEGRLRRGKGWVPETVRRAAMGRPRTQKAS